MGHLPVDGFRPGAGRYLPGDVQTATDDLLGKFNDPLPSDDGCEIIEIKI